MTRPAIAALALAIAACAFVSPATARDEGPSPIHERFETGETGAFPGGGWFTENRDRGEIRLVGKKPAEGKQHVEIERTSATGLTSITRRIDARPFRDQRVRLRLQLRMAAAAPDARAQVAMRISREGNTTGFLETVQHITTPEWTEYAIVGTAHDDALEITISVTVLGAGTAGVDDITVESLGAADAHVATARPLTERGRTNLVAFARLFGYVRHFHPSDEVAAADWERIAAAGVRLVEPAEDAADLADRLTRVFAPVAPTLIVRAGPIEAPALPERGDAVGTTFWRHHGFGQPKAQGPARSIYRSWRVRRAHAGDLEMAGAPVPGDAVRADLGGGVWCHVPLCVAYDHDGTLPPAVVAPALDPWTLPDGWHPTGDDRVTRLADVILVWNVFQHFYPYFDVIDTDWTSVLPATLERAAADPDALAFRDTLRGMVAALQDGHGNVYGGAPVTRSHRLPFTVAWIEDEIVVTAVWEVDAGGASPERGDVLVTLDGRDAKAIWNEHAQRVSAATPQWLRHRLAQEIVRRAGTAPFVAELRRPDGSSYSIRSRVVPNGQGYDEPEPERIVEVEPGLWYVDIDRIDDPAFEAAVGDLARARGIVFDLRGYPGGLSTVVIAHLIDEPVTCAQWHVPRVFRPDRENMAFNMSNWKVHPIEPRFTDAVAFIIDGRAISYAETYMGIIEAYDLAEIVGEATAGTNGNVNPIRLPGGYMVSWTGMKVLKHDGSRHHGVGIEPTVPVERTIAGVAAGRDELLERAVEVVKARMGE